MLAITCMMALASSLFANAQVFERAGDIYYQQASASPQRLTHTGKDFTPILSPDEKVVAFLRASSMLLPKSCVDFADTRSPYADQIWMIDIALKKERLLVEPNFSCSKPTDMIVNPQNLKFSPDSKRLYFLTSAWATSGAVHVVHLTDGKLYYLLPAGSLDIVRDGEYKGYLIVQQHRYFINVGTYDWFWLFSPDGKEIGPLGDDPEVDIMKRV